MTRTARLTPMIPGWAWLWCPTRRGTLVGMTVALDEMDVTPWAAEFRAWNCTNHCVHPHAMDCEAERGGRPTGRACLCVCHDASEGRS